MAGRICQWIMEADEEGMWWVGKVGCAGMEKG